MCRTSSRSTSYDRIPTITPSRNATRKSSRAFHFSAFGGCRLQLVSWGKKGAVGERSDQDRGYGDAAQEHVEDHYLKAHCFQRVGSGDDHADHSARQEDYSRGLRGVYKGDEGTLEGGLEDRRGGLAAGGPEGQCGFDLGPLFGQVVADTSHGQAGRVHGVPYHHTSEWDQIPCRGRHDTEREQ